MTRALFTFACGAPTPRALFNLTCGDRTPRASARLRPALAAAALELFSSSCGSSGCNAHKARPAPPIAASSPTVELSAPSSAVASAPNVDALLPDPNEPSLDWRAAVRRLDWARAYELLRALPSERAAEAPLRLVLGVAALESNHANEAVAAFDKLEEALPLVTEEIIAWRARAMAAAGPYPDAATVLLATNRSDDAMLAAEAYARANEPTQARAAVDRAIQLAGRSKRDALSARLLRATLAEKTSDRNTAIADLRWVLREHPELGNAVVLRIVGLGGAVSLDERLNVLERSATATTIDEIRGLFEELRREPGADARKLDAAWAKALLHARRFEEALPILDRIARTVPGVAGNELRFQAARAASRSGNEADAAKRFAAIANARPTSAWTTRAVLRQADSLLASGRYRDAVRAYTRYLADKKKGAEEAAHHGLALAHLGAGQGASARESFGALKRRASAKHAGTFQELEGVAALAAGDKPGAIALWLDLVAKEPLTWGALMARARLAALDHTPLPPVIGVPEEGAQAMAPLSVALPPAAALLASLGLDAAAEARLTRGEDELGRAHPGRENEAVCLAHAELTAGRRRLQVGERAVKRETLMRPPGAGERWAWRCVYPDAFGPIVAAEERLAELPRGFVHAIMRQESAFDPLATSPVGARGLMQLMPSTARRAAEELGRAVLPEECIRPDVNVQLGAHYLGKLLRSYGGNVALTAAAYNAGPHAVHAWLTSFATHELDVWVATIPFRETRHYVAAVVGNLVRYQYLEGGADAVLAPTLSLPPAPPLGASDY